MELKTSSFVIYCLMSIFKKILNASKNLSTPGKVFGTESNRIGLNNGSKEELQASSNSIENEGIKPQGVLAVTEMNDGKSSGLKDKGRKKSFTKIAIFFTVFFGILIIVAYLFWRFVGNDAPLPLGNKGEIVWWGVQHDPGVYKPLIDKFERDNPNIKIKYVRQTTQDYQARLMSALKSGQGPDIFEIHNTWPVMLKEYLSELPSSVMTKDEFNGSFYPIIVSNLTLDKGIVGMPLEYDALTLFINEDIFSSALKSPPVGWNEFKSLAIGLTQTSGGKKIIQAGTAFGITDNVDHWPEILGLMLIQNGVNPANPVGTKNVPTSSLAKSVITYYRSFSQSKVWDSTLPSSTIAFSRGELAMYLGSTRRASEIVRENPDLKFRTVLLPQLPKNKPDDPSFSYATYWAHAVSSKSKIKEGAWIFLKYLSREDSLKVINNNIAEYETFKRIYPRPNMNLEMRQDQVLGSVISLAYNARSFYLADYTYDGQDGINTLVNNVYKGMVKYGVSDSSLISKSQELKQILGKFGVNVR